MKIASLALTSLLPVLTSTLAAQWHYNPDTGRSYLLLDKPVTYTVAQVLAKANRGQLLSINSSAEWNFIKTKLLNDRSQTRGVWLGLQRTNATKPFRWVWADGTKLTTPAFWGAGEPSGGNETVAEIRISFYQRRNPYGPIGPVEIRHNWNDVSPTSGSRRVIVEAAGIRAATHPQTGQSYLLFRDVTFSEGRAMARRLGGDLVVLDSPGEQSWLRKQFGNPSAWIGLQRSPGNKPFVWSWVDGTPLTRTHCGSGCAAAAPPWGKGEPNNGGGKETRGELRADGRWNDLSPTSRRNAIAEFVGQPAMTPIIHPTNGHSYMTTYAMTFAEARKLAQQMGGDLVVFDEPGELGWVRDNVRIANSHIGLQRSGSGWAWVDGRNLSRTHCGSCTLGAAPWNKGEPNNAGGKESVAELLGSGKWNDVNPADRRPAILEFVGGFSTFGKGFSNSHGQLTSETPRIGKLSFVSLAQLPASAAFLQYIGVTKLASGYPLNALGMDGCQVLVTSIVQSRGGAATQTGTARMPIVLPRDNRLVGVSFYIQAAYVDSAANPLGVGWTNGGHAAIGR